MPAGDLCLLLFCIIGNMDHHKAVEQVLRNGFGGIGRRNKERVLRVDPRAEKHVAEHVLIRKSVVERPCVFASPFLFRLIRLVKLVKTDHSLCGACLLYTSKGAFRSTSIT